MFSKLKIFTGNSNLLLAKEVATFASIPLSKASLFKFSNDDSFVQIHDNVRGSDVFIIQSTCQPVNDNIMELLIMIDSLKRASASRITCVIPYYGYARSDKKDQPRVPITAKLVADILTIAGANRVLTFDLHADQIQGFFNIPVDHLTASPLFANHIKSLGIDNNDLVVVSPDSGGANRARFFSEKLNCSLAIGDKRRSSNNDSADVLNVIGDVNNKTAILFDDIIDTGTSLTKIAHIIKEQGASQIFACCSHGVLSKNALINLESSPIDRLFITDSIPLNEEKKKCLKITQISIAEMLADAIQKIHLEESVSDVFKQ